MVRVLSFLERSRDSRRSRGARCAFWLGVVSIDSWEPLDVRSHERGVFSVGLASKSRALEVTNPEVDGPSFGDGAAALAADARGAGGKAAATLVVGWAGAGVCCDVAPLRAAPAYNEPWASSHPPSVPPPLAGRRVKRRVTADPKERRCTQSVNNAFAELRECIPNAPADTKLSKIKTLRLAICCIAYLMDLLQGPPAAAHQACFKADLKEAHAAITFHQQQLTRLNSPDDVRRKEPANVVQAEKSGKGRTGRPQQVWALELKHDARDSSPTRRPIAHNWNSQHGCVSSVLAYANIRVTQQASCRNSVTVVGRH
ncbi:heart- and neural crest derivatives-expressed protein 2-like [Dermacentor albipictus]|uniref:heart- and neural crest derivatives-expressed protein 2-like n=1 Tax=Dermacentor albipictus TaxID=60249 RepID=UPI0031FBC861